MCELASIGYLVVIEMNIKKETKSSRRWRGKDNKVAICRSWVVLTTRLQSVGRKSWVEKSEQIKLCEDRTLGMEL